MQSCCLRAFMPIDLCLPAEGCQQRELKQLQSSIGRANIIMKAPEDNVGRIPHSLLQRDEVIKQFMLNNISRTRHTKRRPEHSTVANSSADSNFSYLNYVALNPGKKNLLQEQRNTEIERSNRILHQKLARCAQRPLPSSPKASSTTTIAVDRTKSRARSKKMKTSPTERVVQREFDSIMGSRAQSRQKKAMTLFMGHSQIDQVQFKIKIVIANQTYYLIAQNEHTKILLEMPEAEYWGLHYNQFEENPCNIFKYLMIEKGQVKFRVQEGRAKQGQSGQPSTRAARLGPKPKSSKSTQNKAFLPKI